jgi:hypothetical protein
MEGVEPAMATRRAVATTTGRRTGLKIWLSAKCETAVVWEVAVVKMRAPSQAARAEPKR